MELEQFVTSTLNLTNLNPTIIFYIECSEWRKVDSFVQVTNDIIFHVEF